MEMRIVVPAANATSLAERLALVVGAERISLRGDCQEVDVRVEHESDRAILHVSGRAPPPAHTGGISFGQSLPVRTLERRPYDSV
jgi:hypothetical protein